MRVPSSSGCRKLALALAGIASAGSQALSAQSEVAGWGSQVFDTSWSKEPFAEIAAGAKHVPARRSDGTLVAWGENNLQQCMLPEPVDGLAFARISAGSAFSVALLSDGTADAWGWNGAGQATRCRCRQGWCTSTLSPGTITHWRAVATDRSSRGAARDCDHRQRERRGELRRQPQRSAVHGRRAPDPARLQVWYRDLGAGGTGVNTSDAVHIVFAL